jgi:hypothetical protein
MVVASVVLYWIPLGAGGAGFVRVNGRIYEAVAARRRRRRPFDLYHSALEVNVPDGRFVVENAWPSPNADLASRGVVVEGPVFSPRLARLRLLRYEVRRWQNGHIPDAAQAVESPRLLTADHGIARTVLDLVPSVPPMVWGRDQLNAGEMWNSNSVISYVLAMSGLPAESFHPPAGGRAPGWRAGLVLAGRHQPDTRAGEG